MVNNYPITHSFYLFCGGSIFRAANAENMPKAMRIRIEIWYQKVILSSENGMKTFDSDLIANYHNFRRNISFEKAELCVRVWMQG